MTNPAHPGRMLFVNMPVADLERSKAFFAKLGFSYNPNFTDETAACMPVGEHAFVMLLSREKFAEFAKLPIADPTTHTLALYCFSVSSRDEVDTVSAAALAAGGTEADDAEDYGFMYSRSFFDLDDHGWQVMWIDPRRRRSRARRRSRPPRRTPTPQPDPPPRSTRAPSSCGTGSREPLRQDHRQLVALARTPAQAAPAQLTTRRGHLRAAGHTAE
jgi:predicted lactoylglutathione lyase